MYDETEINDVIKRLEACETGHSICIPAQIALEKARDEIRRCHEVMQAKGYDRD